MRRELPMGEHKETMGFRRVLTRADLLRVAVSIPAMIFFIPPVLPVLAVMCLLVAQASKPVEGLSVASPLQLDLSDDGNQLKVLVRHSEIGPVCELWCYEGGPSPVMEWATLVAPQLADGSYLTPQGE